MKRKLLAVLALAAIVTAGASAQLVIGVSGAIPMGSKMTAQQISDQFKSGEGVFYGAYLEVIMHKIGIGFSANTMTMYDSFTVNLYDIIDADLYASYHLFGGRALLDPFGELGFGIIGTQLNTGSDWIDASYYWYAALGLGVNLGPVGISAKFAYNYAMGGKAVELADGSPAPAFGYWLFGAPYLPPYRVTIAAKLLL